MKKYEKDLKGNTSKVEFMPGFFGKGHGFQGLPKNKAKPILIVFFLTVEVFVIVPVLFFTTFLQLLFLGI